MGITIAHGSQAGWVSSPMRRLQVVELQDSEGHLHTPQPAGLHRQDGG